MGKLTVRKCQSITKTGRHGDGNGLYLSVAPGGSKSWIQRLTVLSVRRDMGLGGFPLVSLSQARDLAFENKRDARRGHDPLATKTWAKVPTFQEAAEKAHKANRARWGAAHSRNWLASLKNHVIPDLGKTPVDQITGRAVLHVLGPVWETQTDKARRIRQRIRTVLGWCLAHGYVKRNAAGEGIDGALPVISNSVKNFRALPYQEVSEALKTVEASGACWSAKWALRFLVLTAARSGEVRGATWSEMDLDLDKKEWRVPAERMKGKAEHRVPLSAAAVAVLEQARVLSDGKGLVFPSPMRLGRPLSSMSLTKVLRDTGLAAKATVHGFRSSFRTWASEKTDADHSVMELSLSHRVGSAVEQAYARSDLLAKRQRLMNQWGAYLEKGNAPAKVVNIRG